MSNPNPLYSNGIAFITLGIVLIPFLVQKIKSLTYHENTNLTGNQFFVGNSSITLWVLICVWGLLLLFGYFSFEIKSISVLITPYLSVLAVIIPIIIYLLISETQKFPITRSRRWGALSVGVAASPVLGNLVELGIAAIALALYVIVIIQNPISMVDLESLVSRFSSAQTNPEIINNIISAFIRQPLNKYIVIAIVSGLIPIVEEIIKQTPVWLLSWQKLTPRAGLLIGALGGAGFALTESLFTASIISNSDQWLFQIIGRAGTGLMHIITGAIGGWGLASSFGGRGYLKSIGFYLIAVFIHGAWNGLAIWDGVVRFINESTLTSWLFNGKELTPSLLLVVLYLVMLLFWLKNTKLLKD